MSLERKHYWYNIHCMFVVQPIKYTGMLGKRKINKQKIILSIEVLSHKKDGKQTSLRQHNQNITRENAERGSIKM